MARDDGRPDLARQAETRAHEHQDCGGQLETEVGLLDADLVRLRQTLDQLKVLG